MDVFQKLEILSGAAKYDVSCSSSGTARKNVPNGLGNASKYGICHSFTADGRCISLLKILLTNYCIYDCAYCINRSSNDVPRAAFTPQEVIDLTINFYKRNYIEGLFLSSGIFNNANHTSELFYQILRELRFTHHFNGYIHIKAIPGTDPILIKKIGELTDRMSVNIELPSNESLKLLAPQKNKEAIIKPMSFIGSQIIATKDEKKIFKNTPSFVPAGQSTQLIIGATPDSDFKIMKLSESLYNKFDLKRVYYSAYVPVSSNPKLPAINKPPLLREHRLYQADWLLRFYGFSATELLSEKNPNFNIGLDPKTDWALRNLGQFPIEVNSAPPKDLLRIPGVGVRSVKKIMAVRRIHALTFEDLKKLGVVLKRAKYFMLCSGKPYDSFALREDVIRENLLEKTSKGIYENSTIEQISMFTSVPALYNTSSDPFSGITGEL